MRESGIDHLDELRANARQARRGLDPGVRTAADQSIVERIEAVLTELAPRVVASYLPTDGEPDLGRLHAWCATEAVRLAVPVLAVDHLVFSEMGPETTMVSNRFGVPEPQNSARIDVKDIDVVVAPLVVFDTRLHRAGRGQGWYDRTFTDPECRPMLIGAAYELQKVHAVPVTDHDVTLAMVVTEAAVYR